MPVMIFMHGNAGNKLEGEFAAGSVLPHGVNLFSFDFSGCGNSEGKWVTLGWKERDDLAAVVTYLVSLNTVSKIGVYGRSMGGACSLMYMADHPDQISCAVIDSSFSEFNSIMDHLAKEQMGLPPALVDMLAMGLKA